VSPVWRRTFGSAHVGHCVFILKEPKMFEEGKSSFFSYGKGKEILSPVG
jgi:hypothetical protein